MKKNAAMILGLGLLAVTSVSVGAVEIHHRVRFGHFITYGIHADVVERSEAIGIPGIKTFYAAEVFNYTLFPLTFAGWNYVGDVLGPPKFYCRFQVQELSPQDGHWVAVVDFRPAEGWQGPIAHKRLYPFASLVPMEPEPTGAMDALRKGDLVRFAVFTDLHAPAADVHTEPFRINEVPTIAASLARPIR
ncbi:MAG: hypothetical protein ABSF71_34245 [Terriglobia bacterium]|jgi:hypothetical protein